jgi:hypothetical protein
MTVVGTKDVAAGDAPADLTTAPATKPTDDAIAAGVPLPPLNHADNAFAGFEHFDAAAFLRLEKAGGITLGEGARAALDQMVGDYAQLGHYRGLIDPEQLRILNDIVMHGRAFAKALDAAQSHPALASLLILDRSMLNERGVAYTARNAIRQYAAMTWERVEHAAKELKSLDARPKKRGAPADLVTEKLLSDVFALFEALGGHVGISEKCKGPLARFLAELWWQLPDAFRPKSPQALIRAAGKFIDKRRRAAGA